MEIGIQVAVEASFVLCMEIFHAYQAAKVLPELAKSLSDRVQLFKPRLNQLMEGKTGSRHVDPLPHIRTLEKVLNDIKAYFEKLNDDSIISKVQRKLFYRALLTDYERLNKSLDQCRGDLHFDFDFDLIAERSAFENETKGLTCGLVEQCQEMSQEQHFQREMLQGQCKMLSEILKYLRSHKNLNLTTVNSATIEAATVLVNSAEDVDIQELITQQMSREYEIPAAEISLLDAVIGEGTFGIIYKARYHNEDVAIKKPQRKDTHVLEELLNQSRCDGSVFVASVHEELWLFALRCFFSCVQQPMIRCHTDL